MNAGRIELLHVAPDRNFLLFPLPNSRPILLGRVAAMAVLLPVAATERDQAFNRPTDIVDEVQDDMDQLGEIIVRSTRAMLERRRDQILASMARPKAEVIAMPEGR